MLLQTYDTESRTWPSAGRTSPAPRGAGEVRTHFGEFVQGSFHMPWGPTRGLVTNPCPEFRSCAHVELKSSGDVVTEPTGLTKAIDAARLTLRYLGAPECGALITINSNIVQGIGAGSSTGDVVATIVATALALRRRLADEEVAMLTVETEKASDPTMFQADTDRVRLFGHRTGITLEVFDSPIPPLEIVGITDGATVDTLAHPPAVYSLRTIFEFDAMRAGLRAALGAGDAGAFGGVATRSAEINEDFLPKPRFRTWIKLCQRHGAVGLAVSHSGSAVSFLFDRRDEQRTGRIEDLLGALADLEVIPLVRYELGRLQ